jgi:hypothetical protein
MMRRVLSVTPRSNYVLQIIFDGNEERLFDLRPYLRGSLFEPLQDEELFKQVEVSARPRGLVWPNGADLCADMLYMNSRPHKIETEKRTLSSTFSKMLNRTVRPSHSAIKKRTAE